MILFTPKFKNSQLNSIFQIYKEVNPWANDIPSYTKRALHHIVTQDTPKYQRRKPMFQY